MYLLLITCFLTVKGNELFISKIWFFSGKYDNSLIEFFISSLRVIAACVETFKTKDICSDKSDKPSTVQTILYVFTIVFL